MHIAMSSPRYFGYQGSVPIPIFPVKNGKKYVPLVNKINVCVLLSAAAASAAPVVTVLLILIVISGMVVFVVMVLA